MIEIGITTTRDTEDFLKEFPNLVRQGLVEGVTKSMFFAEAESKKSFGEVGNLKSVTGYLRRSIRSRVKERGTSVVGSIGSDVIYARIHEQQGTKGSRYKLRPRAAEYLVFKVNGNWIKTKSVTIPARPFLRPAINDNLNRIEGIITDSILKKVN